MAHRKQSASDHLYLYYVTDGNGRQLAVGDAVGYDYANPDETDPTAAGSDADEYLSNGGKYAGGMHDSFGFQPERHPSTTAPDLSFFRNRWFDQKTGRWTQEDPLGAAAAQLPPSPASAAAKYSSSYAAWGTTMGQIAQSDASTGRKIIAAGTVVADAAFTGFTIAASLIPGLAPHQVYLYPADALLTPMFQGVANWALTGDAWLSACKP